MNRATRDKFTSGTKQSDLTTGNACWETPPAIYAALNAEFRFDLDVTADEQRSKCSVWFGPQSTHGVDALTADWCRHGRVGFSNPPYGPFVQQLLAKAKAEKANGFTSVLLLPMRVTKAFRAHVLDGATELRFCDKRIVFYENGKPRLNPKTGKPDCALFDSIIVVYRPHAKLAMIDLKVSIWAVPKHV